MTDDIERHLTGIGEGFRRLLPWGLITALVWIMFIQQSRHEETLASLVTGTLVSIQATVDQLQKQVEVNGLVVAPFMQPKQFNGQD